jgi:tetratricopeptide (TPR) repeat protein
MKTTFTILITCLCFLSSFGQYTNAELENIINTSNETKLVQENTQLMLLKFYYQSIKIADKLLEIDPENANYNYRKGYALLYSQSDFTKALPYL